METGKKTDPTKLILNKLLNSHQITTILVHFHPKLNLCPQGANVP